MAEGANSGLLDLEKELTCSVGVNDFRLLGQRANQKLSSDLHRDPVPAVDPS